MGIDGIGKGGVKPPISPTVSTPATGIGGPHAAEPSRPFRVDTAQATTNVDAVRTTPLERFRSGDVGIDGYLDLKVEEATTHLSGLSANELTAVRKMLREQLASDPMLSDLVQHATGRPPTPPED